MAQNTQLLSFNNHIQTHTLSDALIVVRHGFERIGRVKEMFLLLLSSCGLFWLRGNSLQGSCVWEKRDWKVRQRRSPSCIRDELGSDCSREDDSVVSLHHCGRLESEKKRKIVPPQQRVVGCKKNLSSVTYCVQAHPLGAGMRVGTNRVFSTS